MRRLRYRAHLGGVLVIALALASFLVLAAGPAVADPGDAVYWVVPGQAGTASDLTLPEVAQRLLGDSSRAPEILELNEGRAQPDGGALSGDGKLKAGWALVLPAGAKSGEIRIGPLPSAVTPPAGARPAPGPSGNRSLFIAAPIALLALAGLGAAGVLLLRRRRRAAPKSVTVPATAGAREVLDRALRQISVLPSAPSVYAAVVGLDRVSLRLAPALTEAPPPWQVRQQGSVWEAPNWQLDAGPAGAATATGLPLLATLGTIGGELTVVNLGRAPGLVAFTGVRSVALATVGAAVDEIAAAGGTRVFVAGPPPPSRLPTGSVTHVTDLSEVPAGDRLVVVTEPVFGPAAQRLGELAADAGPGTAVVIVGDVPHAAWRFESRPDGSLDAGVLGLTLDAKAGAR